MDAVFLNFHKEEDFSSYFSSYEEDSRSNDGMQTSNNAANYHWLDYERELNGDMGLIPVPTDTNHTLSSSPPIKEDFKKIMTEWNHLVNLEVGDELVQDLQHTAAISLQIQDATIPSCESLISPPDEDMLDIKDFDITKYVVGSEPDIPEKEDASFSLDSPVKTNIKQEKVVAPVKFKQEIVTDDEMDGNDENVEVDMELEDINIGKIDLPIFKQPKIEVMSPKKKRHVVHPPQFGGKRIDMARGRYMVEEESTDETDDEDIAIDVETVEGEVSHPVLQAGDLDSLLEQFEATETTNLELHQYMPSTPEKPKVDDISLDIVVEHVKLISPIKSPLGNANKGKRSLDFRDAKPDGIASLSKLKTEPDASQVKLERKNPNEAKIKDIHLESPTKDTQKNNKQILDALPTELIDRIRASSKRKPVPVIEPIPPIKRRMLNNVKDPITNSTLANRIINSNNNNTPITAIANTKLMATVKDSKNILLDHNYCSLDSPTHAPYLKDAKNSAKDSGFSSAEEDEKIIGTQPTIKNSNGKLMVSLLKTNTIKKKLNLEEYKKRLQTRPTSGGTSPGAAEDDENARRLKHTEMLMKMAQDHLKQGKTMSLITPILAPDTSPAPEKNEEKYELIEVIKQEPIEEVKKPPKNIVMKTLVSVGTNTEESWGHLEQLLQNTHIKISPNSLISVIVEKLPKQKAVGPTVEHGEDKTIVFIDTNASRKSTNSVEVQTLHSSSHLLRQRRRRTSSSSSYSSTSSSSSDSSSCSDDSACGNSQSSSRSRSRSTRISRSRSRTPSPVRRKRQQLVKEVEERRVVYVGRISDDTTKEDLRRRFARFGAINNISVHFRQHGDNYGFVTFLHKEDAYDAVGRGNEDEDLPQYDLSFGGRRLFCKTSYADLDNVHDEEYDDYGWSSPMGAAEPGPDDDYSFDNLLRKAQAKLRNRKL